jgi:hypothetical protein
MTEYGCKHIMSMYVVLWVSYQLIHKYNHYIKIACWTRCCPASSLHRYLGELCLCPPIKILHFSSAIHKPHVYIYTRLLTTTPAALPAHRRLYVNSPWLRVSGQAATALCSLNVFFFLIILITISLLSGKYIFTYLFTYYIFIAM